MHLKSCTTTKFKCILSILYAIQLHQSVLSGMYVKQQLIRLNFWPSLSAACLCKNNQGDFLIYTKLFGLSQGSGLCSTCYSQYLGPQMLKLGTYGQILNLTEYGDWNLSNSFHFATIMRNNMAHYFDLANLSNVHMPNLTEYVK
jgi:hypothetical protein